MSQCWPVLSGDLTLCATVKRALFFCFRPNHIYHYMTFSVLLSNTGLRDAEIMY